MKVFDSSNEATGCTDYNPKKPQHFAMCRCWKNQENPPKNTFFFQKWQFLLFFPDFFSNGKFFGVGVICVVTSASRSFIWAIKHPDTMIFIFWVIMGFNNFSDPPYWEWNIKFHYFSKYFPFSYGIMHTKTLRA